MNRGAITILILALSSVAQAQVRQPDRPATSETNAPWAVSVVHTIDLQRMVAAMREQQNVRVGVAGTAPRYIYNITTGLILDDQGHVVTRLSNLDSHDKDHKLTVMTSDGNVSEAKLVGVDFATGFAVLIVESLRASVPKIPATSRNVPKGSTVRIISSDVVPKTVTDRVYLAPSMNVSHGQIVDSLYSKARGALTLFSESFLARSDGSLVLTSDNQIIGIAQYAGFGRAYVYSIQSIRDIIAKRVIDSKGNVAAGWLGIVGDSVAQLSDPDHQALGLRNKAGVIVRTVAPASPAALAGLLPSDIITRMDESDIAGAADLRAMLSTLPAGHTIKLSAIRNQQSVELTATLAPRPVTEQAPQMTLFDQVLEPSLSPLQQIEKRNVELQTLIRSYQKKQDSRERREALRELHIELQQGYADRDVLIAQEAEKQPSTRTPVPPVPQQDYVSGDFGGEQDIGFQAGFTGRNLTRQLAAILQARGGILVSTVAKDSAAERAGLKAGDVVVGVKERVLMSAAQLQALLSAQRGAVELSVVRNREQIVITMNIP